MTQNFIPASCSNCGAIFKSRLISVGGNISSLKLSGNIETCPYCGGMANTAEGVFNITNNILKVVSSPKVTKQMLQKFNSLVRNAYYNENKDISTLIKESKEISPALGKLVETGSNNGIYVKSFLFLLMFILSSCNIDVKVNLNLDINQLVDQMSDTNPAQITSESSNSLTKLAKVNIQSQVKDTSQTISTSQKKIGRNTPCPCGSGKKYKKCCGQHNISK